MVRRIMGAHNSIYAGPEFDFIPAFVQLRDKMYKRIREGRIDKITTGDVVDEALCAAISHIFDRKLQAVGKTIYCEKSPHNASVFPQLLKIFPESHCIFVLRNPYAIIHSMKQVANRYLEAGQAAPQTAADTEHSIRQINKFWGAGFLALQRSPERVPVVYYEDILEDPEREARRLAKAVKIDFQPDMLRIEETAYDNPTDDTVKYWYSQEAFNKPIDASRLAGDPKSSLSSDDQDLIRKHLIRHPLLERYGFS